MPCHFSAQKPRLEMTLHQVYHKRNCLPNLWQAVSFWWRWRESNPRPKSSPQGYYKRSRFLLLARSDSTDRVDRASRVRAGDPTPTLRRSLPAWRPPHPELVSPSARPSGENARGRRNARLRTCSLIQSTLTRRLEERRGWCECSHLSFACINVVRLHGLQL